MEATLKKLRIIQITLIGGLALLIYLIEQIHNTSETLRPAVLWIMLAFAIYLVITFFSFRHDLFVEPKKNCDFNRPTALH